MFFSSKAFEEGFKDFQHLKSLTSKSEARNMNQDKEMLAFNSSGIFSGALLASQGPGSSSGLAKDVRGKVWHDSERSGRRPNYRERHSPVKGFTSALDDKRDFRVDQHDFDAMEQHFLATGGNQVELASSPPPILDDDANNALKFSSFRQSSDLRSGIPKIGAEKTSSRSRASLIKRTRRQPTEESGAVMKDAQVLQTRLEAAWTKLETPMIKKLQYLEKYSDNNFSVKLSTSVKLWERASVIVPLRESALKLLKEMKGGERVAPKDIFLQLKGIEGTGCYFEPKASFFFEQRLDAGEVVDEELLAVFETFDDRGDLEKDVYMIEALAWLEKIAKKINDSVLKLSSELKGIGEMILYRGNPYVVKS